MKNTLKSSLLFLLILVMATSFVGCTNHELSLISGAIKAANVKSATLQTDLSIDIDTDASWISESAIPANILEFLNCLSFSTTQKYIQNRAKNAMSVKTEFAVAAEDMSFKSTYWVDASKDKFVEIFQIPTLAKLALPAESKDAKYFVMDLNALQESEFADAPQMDFNRLIPSSYEFQEKYLAFIENYTKTAKIEPPTVTFKQGNIMGSVYETNLSDKDFKQLLKSVVNDFMTNPETRKLTEEFTLDLLDFYSALNPMVEWDDWKSQTKAFFNAFESNPTQYTMVVNLLLGNLDKIPMLGSEGIKATYTINHQGYLVKTESTIDLVFDFAAVERLFVPRLSNANESKLFQMKLKYDTKLSDIDAIASVDLPTITPENSIDFIEMMESLTPDYSDDDGNYDNNTGNYNEDYDDYMFEKQPEYVPEEGEIVVYGYDMRYNFENKPVLSNDTLYIPLTEFLQQYTYYDENNTWWDADTNTVHFKFWGAEMYYSPGADVIITDGITYQLHAPTKVFNGVDYVPLRSFIKILHTTLYVEWDAQTNSVHIRYYDELG